MNIKFIGFDYPPMALIDLIKKLPASDETFWILEPFTGQELPYGEIASDDRVVINTHEPACHEWFDRLLPQLHQEQGLPWSHILLHTGCLWDPDSPVTNIGSIVDECTDFLSRFPTNTDVSQCEPRQHFICLNRVHRWQRLDLVRKLLPMQDHGTLSYPPVANDHRFPLIVDVPNPSWAQGYQMDFPELTGSLFNVVTESCYEANPVTGVKESHVRPGLTEKTFKTMLLGQIPIWLASWQTVRCYRELGFDAFDDIIDHAYDLEPDPLKRIDMVVAQVQKIIQMSKQELREIKTSLMPRFRDNLDRLRRYAHNHVAELPRWRQWFDLSC